MLAIKKSLLKTRILAKKKKIYGDRKRWHSKMLATQTLAIEKSMTIKKSDNRNFGDEKFVATKSGDNQIRWWTKTPNYHNQKPIWVTAGCMTIEMGPTSIDLIILLKNVRYNSSNVISQDTMRSFFISKTIHHAINKIQIA